MKLNQDSCYQFLISPDFKAWFLARFNSPRFNRPYDSFMFSFSRFLELKGTGENYHFKVGKMLCSLMVASTGTITLGMNIDKFVSGRAECPIKMII